MEEALKKKEEEVVEVAQEDQDWNDKLVPIARKIFKAIAERIDDAPMSIVKKIDGESREWAQGIVKLALEDMLEKDVRYIDNKQIFQLLIQPIAYTMDMVQNSLGMNYERALGKAFGCENESSLTLKQINDVLLADTRAEEALAAKKETE